MICPALTIFLQFLGLDLLQALRSGRRLTALFCIGMAVLSFLADRAGKGVAAKHPI